MLGAPAIAGARTPADATAATVFAAASLQDALRELGAEWRRRGRPAPRFSFAASSALARQIEQGAPADLFLSADEGWMDYLAARDLILPGSRTSPLGNSLVLVTLAGGDGRRPLPAPVALERGADLLALLGPSGRLAVGDPDHVLAGRYAQAALRWSGGWDALAPRLARAENVRAALLLVERSEARSASSTAPTPRRAAGRSGSSASSRRRATRPRPTPSRSPAARRPAAPRRALLGFLAGPEAADTRRRFGFTLQQ